MNAVFTILTEIIPHWDQFTFWSSGIDKICGAKLIPMILGTNYLYIL